MGFLDKIKLHNSRACDRQVLALVLDTVPMKNTGAILKESVLASWCLCERQTEAEWAPTRAGGTVTTPGLNTISLQGFTGQVKQPLHTTFHLQNGAISYFKGLL